jgi:hypothetical protein
VFENFLHHLVLCCNVNKLHRRPFGPYDVHVAPKCWHGRYQIWLHDILAVPPTFI